MTKEKKTVIIWLVVGAVILLILFLVFQIFFASPKSEHAGKELNIWVVGHDAELFRNIYTNFQDANTDFARTNVKITEFADYEGYMSALPRAIIDNESPDVFMIENTGTIDVFGDFIEPLPGEFLDLQTFTRDHKSFVVDDLLRSDEFQLGKTPYVGSYLIGVPLGFQTPAFIYNKTRLKGAPEYWDELFEFNRQIRDNYSTLGIGVGLGGVNVSDSLLAFFAQNSVAAKKDDIFDNTAAWKAYESYREEENNLEQFSESFFRGEDVVDQFLQGNIGALIGTADMLEQMEARKQSATVRLFTAPLPKIRGKEPRNVVFYNTLVASKYTQYPEIVLPFMQYMMSQWGQIAYLDVFEKYLPTNNRLIDAYSAHPVSSAFGSSVQETFVSDEVDYFTIGTVMPWEFDSKMIDILNKRQSAQITKTNIASYLDCLVQQVIYRNNTSNLCE